MASWFYYVNAASYAHYLLLDIALNMKAPQDDRFHAQFYKSYLAIPLLASYIVLASPESPYWAACCISIIFSWYGPLRLMRVFLVQYFKERARNRNPSIRFEQTFSGTHGNIIMCFLKTEIWLEIEGENALCSTENGGALFEPSTVLVILNGIFLLLFLVPAVVGDVVCSFKEC
ncbi:hypothetical protein BG004_000804 [Podila humilis]|nr:hypothetical protein BG004_000804 [Podila humilis]